jgi:alpha-1,3-mannosyltransferase
VAQTQKRKYFFALDIRQKINLLPRLMGSVVEALRFLGPENCALSVVEGNSIDGTYEVLKTLQAEVEKLGSASYFQRSDLDPGTGDRIIKLAKLRNLALAPLTDHPEAYAANATVIFLNDVAICLEDILELIHQRQWLGADMTCGMDWVYVGRDPTFYDVWIARTITGDLFFDIPPDGNWNSAWNLFWNAPDDKSRLAAHKPFQVFSCWNGAVAISARPFLERLVAFRGSRPGECYQGEPKLFCKDIWFAGYGKIAVVPSVNLEYTDEAARKIKSLKGYAGQWVGGEDDSYKIDWQLQPPEKVKCIPAGYDSQEWRPWNETLA